MPLEYILSVLALLLGSGISLGLAIYLERRHHAPGARLFTLFLLALVFWSVLYIFELSSTTLQSIVSWVYLEYVGIVVVPSAWLCFILYYTGEGGFLTGRRVGLLLVVPAITLGFVFTNGAHGLFWAYLAIDTSRLPYVVVTQHGPAFWVHTFYSYLLIFLATLVLVRFALRSKMLYRRQAFYLLLAALAPWIGNVIYLAKVVRIDLTPLAFSFSGLCMAWSIIRYRLLDIAPVAYSQVFGGLVDPAIVVDRENRIVELNPAAVQLLNVDGQTALGKPAADLLPAQARDLLPAFIELFGSKSAATEINETIPWLVDGQRRYYDLNISPLFDRRNRLNGRLAILHDITPIKNIERDLAFARDQAIYANQTKSQILDNVSFDLRSPLNTILGYVELLRQGLGGEPTPQQMDTLDRVLHNVNQMTFFVEDLLDQAAIEKGKISLNETVFSVSELADLAQASVEASAIRKGLALSFQLDPELPERMLGDPHRLQQILCNLANNAIRYTGEGWVTVRLFCQGPEEWGIQVSDTGVGIPAQAREMIYEPFWQVDGSPTRKYGGAGLGLSIVKYLVAIMEGRIELVSELGRGSIFTIYLPLRRPVGEAEPDGGLS